MGKVTEVCWCLIKPPPYKRRTGSTESTHVKTPHCWKSHVTAHMLFIRNTENNHFCVMNC